MGELSYQEAVEQIRDRLDIVEVVSQYVILKKSGANYWGLCPFHKEKTPSFSVTPRLGIYKCFGCGEGGDSFSFLMKIENKSFAQVVEEQAEKFGIELPKSYSASSDMKDKKKKMYEVLEKSAQYFQENLFNSQEAKVALEYLYNRGIDENIIKTYGLGYSMNSQDLLQAHLGDKYDKEILEMSGLVIKKSNQKGYLDRFRNRIMIPIKDEGGNIVAFGARALSSEQNPKYLNSPDSILYNKSKILYGIYEAKDAIKEQDSCIIMEGYFDVISPQSHGLKNCVASCGTSLTLEHIKLISRYTNSRRIYLAFDTDLAGRKATQRGAELIIEAFEGLGNIKQFDQIQTAISDDKYSCEIRVVSPPEGKDPDEYIREKGIEAYREHVKNAPLLIDFQMEQALKDVSINMQIQEKLKIVKQLEPIINGINNEITRKEYIKKVAQKLNISEKALLNEISATNLVENQEIIVQNTLNVKKRENIYEKTQKNLLSLYLLNESNLNIQNLNQKLIDIEFEDKVLNKIKTAIDKIIFQVNNVLDLTKGLYTQFAEDNEEKEVLTDLIYLSESFKGLSEKDYDVFIEESIRKLNHLKAKRLKASNKEQNQNVEDNEIKAKEYQIFLRDKIKKYL